mmetsp:Transcript_21390/g.53011  ORF Transcript_21390/g.53011 Transcript_21390/m.53011 type:complete len:1402 (+) Transcript_21390:120-4325(+)
MFRSSDRRVGGDVLEDNLASLTRSQQDDQMSDDDNAAPEMASELDEGAEELMDDPRKLALEDLEGRVVNALDDVMQHSGVKQSGATSVQDELATFLRPVIEVAAHTAPSIARTYYQGGVSIAEGVEASCDEVYQQIVSDLVLPSLFDIAQTDISPSKRSASLEFFRTLFKEFQKPGSWLDVNYTNSANAGPYGSGNIGKRSSSSQRQPPAQLKRRQFKRLQREGEILRYWVKASIACLTPGVFTAEASEMTVASRGVIAASASIRPSLKHIAQRIRDADDRGANKIFAPVMQMVEGVLKKLFFSTSEVEQGDALRSSCIKFLEIFCLCCSGKPQDSSSRRKENTPDDFSLKDLPAGHPIITRESLESIADYAFATLRGLTMLGGQAKIDANLLSDMLMGESTGLPTAPVLSILKPAALAYLEIESNLPSGDSKNALDINIDRDSLEFDFFLSQKSYALTVNAVAVLATNRPVFFYTGAVCLARRCADPPSVAGKDEGIHSSNLSRSSVLAIRSHIKSSCLTLLRNALSVQTKSSTILHKVLVEKCSMKIQADKALGMAETTVKLKTAGRAARNQAKMHYEWETINDERTSKRKRETDDALAKMRTAKVARGLGNGIQLPPNTVDAIELVIENMKNLPLKRPPDTKSVSKRKTPFTLDFLLDAVMTNGASLIQEEGRWYSRDGGTAWSTTTLGNDWERKYELNSKLLGKDSEGKENKSRKTEQRKLFDNQCQTAASEALGRITVSSLSSRNGGLSEFANTVTARLAWMLKGVPPSENMKPAYDMALDSIERYKARIDEDEKKDALDNFAQSYPLVASCLSMSSTSAIPYGKGVSSDTISSLSNAIVNEAYVQDLCDADNDQHGEKDSGKYDTSLEIFVGSVVHANERSNEKPTDAERKNRSADATSSLQQEFGMLPRLSTSALQLVSAMCDLDDITKKAAEAARKNSQQTIAASAALHAAKQAAEKRANTALLVIRDACFQRDKPECRKEAVRIAVRLAAGQFSASPSCEEKALKLVINMLYPRSQIIADYVVEAATAELESISNFAQENYKLIQKANRDAKENENETSRQSPVVPESEEEKEAMDKARKPTILFMALCIRRPELIRKLFELSSLEKADVLAKTVKQNMAKLARAAGMKHGSSDLALTVAEATTKRETSLLLSFLDTLAPVGEKNMVSEEFVETCYKIQEMKAEAGVKNPRYLIPVIFAVKRQDLVPKLSQFVVADSDVFMAALVKMAERLGRQALLFRDEPNPEEPSLKGMTYCEELVFLHKLDGVKQKEYLDAIKMCLDNEEVFNDQVVMSALDHMSGVFLTGTEGLPLAFMRTCILVCSKHESLHSWICHTLLPRLVDGKIYEESRQWEGWMRCAKMLESHADRGVSSEEAIDRLPPEQLAKYKERYGS